MQIYLNLLILYTLLSFNFSSIAQINKSNEIVKLNDQVSDGFLTLERIQQNWVETAWVNSNRLYYTYGSNNELITSHRQIWSGNSWNDVSQELSTYDSDNKLILRIINNWNGSNWDRYKIFSYLYDIENKLIEVVDSGWSKIIYNYDTDLNLDSRLVQSWTGFDWQDYTLYNYLYNSNNNVISYSAESWNGTSWDHFWIENYSYINNNQTESILLYWIDNNWLNDTRKEYIYNPNDKITDLTSQTWQNNQWQTHTNINIYMIRIDYYLKKNI
jgi:hypothetical protein